MAIPIVPQLLRDHVASLAAEDKRLDGRGRWEGRKVVITPDCLYNAEGSAKVEWGDTIVYAGVKFEPRTPYPDRPNQGGLMTSAELRPIAGPHHEPGPPSPESIELGRVIDRGIRESGCIDTEGLGILPGEKAWFVSLDIHVIQDRGNMFDAGGLAAIVALQRATVPASRYDLGEDHPLEISKTPIMCTFSRVGGRHVFDADLDEELGGDERISITVGEDGHLHSLQKGLKGAFSWPEFNEMFEVAQARAADLRALIDEL